LSGSTIWSCYRRTKLNAFPEKYEIVILSNRQVPVSIGVLFIGWFLIGEARNMWTRYWLLKDGQQETAAVTYEHARNVVDYSYRVGGGEYKGTDRRRYLRERHEYVNVMLGAALAASRDRLT
jgi:hypothetical protein